MADFVETDFGGSASIGTGSLDIRQPPCPEGSVTSTGRLAGLPG